MRSMWNQGCLNFFGTVLSMLHSMYIREDEKTIYSVVHRIVGKFGEENVWWIYFSERLAKKFGEWIDQPKGNYL